jgi:hypothetical protein
MTQLLSLVGPTKNFRKRNPELMLELALKLILIMPTICLCDSDRDLNVLLWLSNATTLYEYEREDTQR